MKLSKIRKDRKLFNKLFTFSYKKKAELTNTEILELILAAAGIFLLVFLMYKLISPIFDKDSETAKNYLKSFEEEIKKADNGNVGEFLIWQDTEKASFYLVYFGDKVIFDSYLGDFIAPKLSKNQICVCYSTSEKVNCKNCLSLKYPVRGDYFNEMGYSPFLIKKDDVVIISKGSDYYNFLSS